MSDICECVHFEEGDWVESRLNADIFGIVVGDADFGRYINVQLAGSLEIKQHFAVTLRHMDLQEDEPPLADQDDNVVDFTKERELRNTTTTRGAA